MRASAPPESTACSASRLAASHHCTSSTESNTGRVRLTAPSQRVTNWNACSRANAGSRYSLPAGRRGVSSAADGTSRSSSDASSSWYSSSRANGCKRSGSTSARSTANGASARSRQTASSTSAPSSLASTRNSRNSRVLPAPASPRMIAARDFAARASSHSARSRSSSAARPTTAAVVRYDASTPSAGWLACVVSSSDSPRRSTISAASYGRWLASSANRSTISRARSSGRSGRRARGSCGARKSMSYRSRKEPIWCGTLPTHSS